MPFGLLRRKPVQAIGLDIGTRLMKIMDLTVGRGRPRVSSSRVRDLPEEAIVNREVLDRIVVTERLRELSVTAGIENREVVSGISRGVIIRYATIPKTREGREEQIEQAARQNIPFDLADVIWDSQIIEDRRDEYEVLLVAARQEVIWSHLDLLRSSNLNPVKIVPEHLGWYYTLKNLNKSLNCIIVDIGYAFTDVIHFRNGRIVSSRDVPFGVKAYFDTMRREMGFSQEKGEDILFERAEAEDVAVWDMVNATTDEFIEQLERQFSYSWTTEEEKPDMIYLSGGGARITSLRDKISERFGVPVEILDPVEELTGATREEGPIYGVSFGLASALGDPTGINLMPYEERPAVAEPLLPRIALPAYTVLFAGLLLSFLVFRERSRIQSLRSQLASLESEERVLKSQAAALSDILSKEKEIKQRSSIIKDLVAQRTRYVKFFDELNYLLPSDIWLTGIEEVMENGQPRFAFRIQGLAPRPESLSDFVRVMEDSGVFSEVSLSYAKREVIEDAAAISFEVIVYPNFD